MGMKSAQIWTLTNKNGLIAKLTDFGATLVQLHVPDGGRMADIVQGFDDVSGYANSQFAGATVGRVGNRIDNGTFMIDGTSYTVTGAGRRDDAGEPQLAQAVRAAGTRTSGPRRRPSADGSGDRVHPHRPTATWASPAR